MFYDGNNPEDKRNIYNVEKDNRHRRGGGVPP
jgi:hypothetical protein